MGIYIEALILYILLFFSGLASVFTGTSPESFSPSAESVKILMYYIPSLALIWYLIFRARKIKTAENGGSLASETQRSPEIRLVKAASSLQADKFKLVLNKNDLICVVTALLSLLITGFGVSWLSGIGGTSGEASLTQIQLPSVSSITQWTVLCISCFFSSYLEESYFRYYLLTKRKEMNLSAPAAVILSVLMFSVCHMYAGVWSFVNAAVSGVILSILFLKFNSIHGIAIAHGLYNIAAFILYSVMN